MVSVTGFSTASSAPTVNTCYEMVVKFEGNAEFLLLATFYIYCAPLGWQPVQWMGADYA